MTHKALFVVRSRPGELADRWTAGFASRMYLHDGWRDHPALPPMRLRSGKAVAGRRNTYSQPDRARVDAMVELACMANGRGAAATIRWATVRCVLDKHYDFHGVVVAHRRYPPRANSPARANLQSTRGGHGDHTPFFRLGRHARAQGAHAGRVGIPVQFNQPRPAPGTGDDLQGAGRHEQLLRCAQSCPPSGWREIGVCVRRRRARGGVMPRLSNRPASYHKRFSRSARARKWAQRNKLRRRVVCHTRGWQPGVKDERASQ